MDEANLGASFFPPRSATSNAMAGSVHAIGPLAWTSGQVDDGLLV